MIRCQLKTDGCEEAGGRQWGDRSHASRPQVQDCQDGRPHNVSAPAPHRPRSGSNRGASRTSARTPRRSRRPGTRRAARMQVPGCHGINPVGAPCHGDLAQRRSGHGWTTQDEARHPTPAADRQRADGGSAKLWRLLAQAAQWLLGVLAPPVDVPPFSHRHAVAGFTPAGRRRHLAAFAGAD